MRYRKISEKEAFTRYDEYLLQEYGMVVIAGAEFEPGPVLQDMSPGHYRDTLVDWCDGEGLEMSDDPDDDSEDDDDE